LNVVISQSMYFPWVGILEQVRLCDVFVHYDDVQFSKGSFTNRVQVKQEDGTTRWMTLPLQGHRLGQLINEVQLKPNSEWTSKHMDMLRKSFLNAPFKKDALELADSVLNGSHTDLYSVSRASLMALCDYFNLIEGRSFIDSSSLMLDGASSERVLDIVVSNGGNKYISGHGALKYLDHELFERANIEVLYMDYKCTPYGQDHGIFTPYVTGLDLVAYAGKGGLELIQSQAVNWRNFQKPQ
jgi:hypothetical protein